MEYRSNLFRIFSYLFVLSIGMSLVGPAQAFSVPDGQSGSLQSGKIQCILESDLETIPCSSGQLARENYLSGLLVQHQLGANGLPSKSSDPITGRLQISDIYPSIAMDERRQLLGTIIQNRVNKSFHHDIGRNLLMPVSGRGTITYIDLEGGFYGIITDDGAKYLPLNLPDGYESDGTEVEFTAVIAQDYATIAMWGVPVNLLSITRTGNEDTGDRSRIAGSWLCIGYRNGTMMQSLIPGTEIIADFETDGRVTGTCGCNIYFAEYLASAVSLDIGTAGMTEMYCLGPDGVMEQEQLYLTLLCSASTFDITNGMLTIQDGTGSDILLFDRIESEPENN
jgi:hypothetical protein